MSRWRCCCCALGCPYRPLCDALSSSCAAAVVVDDDDVCAPERQGQSVGAGLASSWTPYMAQERSEVCSHR